MALRRVIAVLLLGGCASVTPPAVTPLPSSLTTRAPECLPPGIPALSTLVQIGQRSGLAPEAGTGRSVRIRSVLYLRERGTTFEPDFIVYYVPTEDGERIAAVDDYPSVPIPEWVDTGIVTTDGELRPDRHATCQWVRLVPREHI